MVNTQQVSVGREESSRALVDVLRDDFHCTDVKIGCREGSCGACTVLVDGAPLPSCIVPVGRVDGSSIETVAHIATTDPIGRSVAESFATHNALQCGYCTAGFVCSSYALARRERTRRPTSREAVATELRGHICRCTGYRPILDAIADVLDLELDDGSHDE